MSDDDVTRAELEALAAKLDQLDLTDREHDVMLAVFAAAGETIGGDEVAGYAIGPCVKLIHLGIAPCVKLIGLGVNPCLKLGRPSLSQGFLGSFGV